MNRLKTSCYVGAFIFSILYLLWRGIFTLPLNGSIFEFIYGFFLWISEILSISTAFILIWNKKTSYRTSLPLDVNKKLFPDVDILIATHNEPVELLYKTINACTFIKYPDKSKVHIYLCDDKNRIEMKNLAEIFNINYVGLQQNRHAKAGNLNNALSRCSSPLVATFDADMIPYSDFLMVTVPYFVDNYAEKLTKKVGFVQTPQSFYNADIFQKNLYAENIIPNEQDFFSREVNILNSNHNSAIYTGSNTLFLRKAIDQAGGFPTNTLTEDFQLGAEINSCGYDSLSTIEPMASGLTPNDIGSVFSQRVRWARGMIQSVKNLRLLSNKHLTISQKIVYFNGYLYWWSFFSRILFICAPILFSLFNFQVVNTNFWLLLIFWIPGYLLLTYIKHDVSGSITNQRWGEIQETFFAPYLIIPVLLETLGIKSKNFKVTNKNTMKISRKEIIYAIPHIFLLLLTVISLIKFNYGKFGSEILYGSIITFWLLNNCVNIFFSILLFFGKPNNIQPRFCSLGSVNINDLDSNVKGKIEYLTESELLVTLPDDMALSLGQEYKMTLLSDVYLSQIKAKVKQVTKSNQYLTSIEASSEGSYHQLLQIIHDGFNSQLPQKRDKWITMFDLLLNNINHRLEIYDKILKKLVRNNRKWQ